jgi:hypothetical protein
MSDADTPPPSAGPPPVPPPASMPPPPPRHGCLTAVMVIVGIVLLLPGLCAVVFGVGSLSGPGYNSWLTPFIVVGLLVGFGGIMLIRSAIRGRRG